MSDAPPTEVQSTPAVEPAPAAAPAAEPAVAPAVEPADAPAAAPAAAPAQKAGDYPVAAAPAGAKSTPAARSTYMGQSFDMSQDQLDQIVFAGLSSIEQQKAAQQQPAPGAQPPTEDEPVTALRGEVAQLRNQMNAGNYEARVQNETSRINQSLEVEVQNHTVFKDNPDLAELGRKSALALLNHNPRMTEAEAMKSVANDFGGALNKKKEQWVQGKMSDAASAEAGPGGEPTASPTEKPLTGKDLMRGKVRDRAMCRVENKQLIT